MLGAASLLCSAAPALAQADGPIIDAAPEPVTVPPAPIIAAPVALSSTGPTIDAYYQARGNAPLWFRDAASLEAAKLLPAILRRGQIEGLTNAAELAGNVEAAIQRAQTASSPAPAPKKGEKPRPVSNSSALARS